MIGILLFPERQNMNDKNGATAKAIGIAIPFRPNLPLYGNTVSNGTATNTTAARTKTIARPARHMMSMCLLALAPKARSCSVSFAGGLTSLAPESGPSLATQAPVSPAGPEIRSAGSILLRALGLVHPVPFAVSPPGSARVYTGVSCNRCSKRLQQ